MSDSSLFPQTEIRGRRWRFTLSFTDSVILFTRSVHGKPFLNSLPALSPEQWFANSPPMMIHTEPSSQTSQSVIHTESRSCGSKRGVTNDITGMTCTHRTRRLLWCIKTAPSSDFQNNNGGTQSCGYAQLLQTQAKLLFCLYNLMQTTADSTEQRVSAIKSESDEWLVRSRERFVAKRRADLRRWKQKHWAYLNRLAALSERRMWKRERPHSPFSGQMSRTILTTMNGGVIFAWRETHLTLCWSWLGHTWGAGQQTGDSLWNLGFNSPLLCGGILRQVNTVPLVFLAWVSPPCVYWYAKSQQRWWRDSPTTTHLISRSGISNTA